MTGSAPICRGIACRLCASLVLLSTLGACVDGTAGARARAWPDTFVARLEALALIEALNGELLSHDSATLTLEHWCEVHRLASAPRIVAVRVPQTEKPASPEQRRDLQVGHADSVRYRRVRLLCGEAVLSEADNWYVPGRLTPQMNMLLDSTDTPFGKAVQALNFRRRTLSSTLLWRPLPEGWEMGNNSVRDRAGALSVPAALLEHRALLTLPDGTPISEVVETYTGNLLAFPYYAPPGR